MRILHTSDWHLGKLFHKLPLIDDQAHVLAQLVESARDTKPDVLLLPGDLFDRSVPSVEAMELFEDIMAELVLKHGIRVCASRGNHESDTRFEFGARFFVQAHFHVFGEITQDPAVLELSDAHGAVYLGVIPYAVPSVCRERLGEESLTDHDKAMAALTARLRARIPAGARSIVMAHAYVEGGRGSDSERELTVGASGAVDASRFDGFHYVALGHLHGPQWAGRETIRYCGSPLKYSFSETDHKKSVSLIEMDGKGLCRIEAIPLQPKRDVRIMRGRLADLLVGAEHDPGRNDFLKFVLTDEGALIDPMSQLRQVYPYALEIEREVPFLPPGELKGIGGDHRVLAVGDILKGFFREMRGADLSADETRILDETIAGIRAREGETA